MEPRVSTRTRARLDEYATFHRTLGNEVCHFVGIPLIVAGAGRLFAAVPLFALGSAELTLTELVLLAVAAFYVIEARGLGLVTAVIIVLLAELARLLPFYWGLALFLVGWAVQFIGHARFEHRSPAFLGNLVHLLVGPAWLVERAVRRERAA
ncbi:MAG TPA: Mpo1-like protein [Polyangiaceae bacterium]|jgi:uncharacterized membrane protein YGL010W|nr:Mpo1-like protein [Polyangiaceae bacterium]